MTLNKYMSKFRNFANDKIKEIDPILSLDEGSQYGRYSVEVNYRTNLDEAIDSFVKLCLGYVSAGLKNCGYHCKTVLNNKPYRLLVGSRNWDDGEWVGVITFDTKTKAFMISQGSYNKDKKTVSISKTNKSEAISAGDLVKEARTLMEKLKRTDPVRIGTLDPVKLKRGPKPSISKIKKLGKS